jgi:predicted phosphodiesterase
MKYNKFIMKCAVTSDVHYGYDENSRKVHEKYWAKLAAEGIETLFVVGDLGSTKLNDFKRCLRVMRKYLPTQKIIICCGNHDYWDRRFAGHKLAGLKGPAFLQGRRKLSARQQPQSYALTRMCHQKWCRENNVILLDGTSHDLSDKLIVLGFQGWYNNPNPPTNDAKYMPEYIESAPFHHYLTHKAHRDLDAILNIPTEGKTVICLTHFPPFSNRFGENFTANKRYLNFIAEKSDYLFVGHSHRACDFTVNGCRVINAGCGGDPKYHGYNHPQYVILNIEA